jgi:hypothetical protein
VPYISVPKKGVFESDLMHQLMDNRVAADTKVAKAFHQIALLYMEREANF